MTRYDWLSLFIRVTCRQEGGGGRGEGGGGRGEGGGGRGEGMGM